MLNPSLIATQTDYMIYNNADGFGAWDSRNCRVINETAEEMECGCDHLTHFAILLVSRVITVR